jgi:hypothetical protein
VLKIARIGAIESHTESHHSSFAREPGRARIFRGVVANTGSQANRLMSLNRVQDGLPPETYETRQTRTDKGSDKGSVPAPSKDSDESAAPVSSADERINLIAGAIRRTADNSAFRGGVSSAVRVGHRRPSRPAVKPRTLDGSIKGSIGMARSTPVVRANAHIFVAVLWCAWPARGPLAAARGRARARRPPA